MRWLRLALVVSMAVLTLAFTGNGFAGCTGSPPTGEPLPVGSEMACFAASDCMPVGCEDRRCISGRCVEFAPFRDADEDGEAPMPCGGDCDDNDARVFPGGAEACNGRDDDCDERIDEDAPPGAIATPIGTADATMASAAIADRIVLTDTGFGTGLRLRTADFDGHISSATPITTEMPGLFALSSAGDGAVLVTVRSEGAAFVIEARPLSLDASRALVVGAVDFTRMVDVQPSALVAEPFGSTFAIVWDDFGGQRFVMAATWTDPVPVALTFTGVAPLDLANDGTHLAVPADGQVVEMFDGGSATSLGTVMLPGRLAEDPLASSTGDFVVAYRDAFDHQLARMTTTDVSDGHTAPAVGTGFPLRVDETPLGVLVTRFDTIPDPEAGVHAQLMSDSLDATIASFRAADVSAGVAATPQSFDVIASETGTAILTNFGSEGAVLTVLGCQPR